MKRLSALLVAVLLVLTLCACAKKAPADSSAFVDGTTTQNAQSEINTSSEQTSQTDNANSSDIGSSSSKKSPSSSKVSAPSSSSKVQTPSTLNPKTDFKWGKYVAKYYSADKKTYYICTLTFYKEYEGVQRECAIYYTKEECERLYSDFGFDADNLDENFSSITVSGVKYYTFEPAYEILPEALEITDTAIKVSPDYERWVTFSLNANGNLVISATDNDRYGKVGTVYTPAQ